MNYQVTTTFDDSINLFETLKDAREYVRAKSKATVIDESEYIIAECNDNPEKV
jgi:hypothetical protein